VIIQLLDIDLPGDLVVELLDRKISSLVESTEFSSLDRSLLGGLVDVAGRDDDSLALRLVV